MQHAIIHGIKDTLIIVPVLFLTYLVIEFIEHRAGNSVNKIVAASGKAGPLLGSLVGLIPQCGFSGAAASLFAVGTLSAGTLIAVFMATSDEMLPILISSEGVSSWEIFLILSIKFVSGVLFGYITDILYKRKNADTIKHMCEEENCNCEHDGIIISALKHTVKITVIILIATCLINMASHFIGEENLESFVVSVPVLGEMLSGIIGLIPNCSSSVLLTNLYVKDVLTMGQLISGLCVNAGVGIIVLFKANKNLKENFVLTGVLYLFGVLAGITVSLLI